jgi:hypothetical protein
MNLLTKTILIITMTTALFFGFLHLFFPAYNFERLHIFLFNLCSGGTVILIYSEGGKGFSVRTGLFYLLSLVCALFAFLHLYAYTASAVLLLALLAETVRVKKFSFIPWNFIQRDVAIAEKYHHASLLCLSLALIISAIVIYNHEYARVLAIQKLTLDIFFLGFSFPVSLITMSVMFRLMKESKKPGIRVLGNVNFWTINIGVIAFFLSILMQMFVAELIIAGILFISVVTIFIFHINLGFKKQSKTFLTSGMLFLIMSAITGIIYIPSHLFLPEPPDGKIILKLHALISLYGWNLSGLAVICRYHDFPIKLNSERTILFHWAIVLFIAPIGFYFKPVSITAVLAYGIFLYVVFFSKGSRQSAY